MTTTCIENWDRSMPFGTRRQLSYPGTCMARSLFAGTDRKEATGRTQRRACYNVTAQHSRKRNNGSKQKQQRWERTNDWQQWSPPSASFELHADDRTCPCPPRLALASRSSCRSTCAWRPRPCTRRRGSSRSGTRWRSWCCSCTGLWTGGSATGSASPPPPESSPALQINKASITPRLCVCVTEGMNQARTCGDEEEHKDEEGSGGHAARRQRHPLHPKLNHARSQLAIRTATHRMGWNRWEQEARFI